MPNDNTVYILGAGFNRDIKDWHESRPPLARDFFQIILINRRYQDRLRMLYGKKVEPLYTYIEEKFGKTKDDLSNQNFDLSKLLISLESDQAYKIYYILKAMFAEFLSEF